VRPIPASRGTGRMPVPAAQPARLAHGVISMMTKPRRVCRKVSWLRSTKTAYDRQKPFQIHALAKAITAAREGTPPLVAGPPVRRSRSRLQDSPGRGRPRPEATQGPAAITALARRRRGADHGCGRSRPVLHARVGMLRAMNHGHEHVFSDRKETHWGKRKLKRDE
jgi:hypothetical protein